MTNIKSTLHNHRPQWQTVLVIVPDDTIKRSSSERHSAAHVGQQKVAFNFTFNGNVLMSMSNNKSCLTHNKHAHNCLYKLANCHRKRFVLTEIVLFLVQIICGLVIADM